MKKLAISLAIAACGCAREVEPDSPNMAAVASDPSLPGEGSISTPPAVEPRPKDQAQLDRMILAGYTPHGDHLHRPGVIECPLADGGESVM